uniref:Phytosulfokine n=1 Tax=Cucumis melo TaxID=3656 RepID=A0A9I9CS91_CUCME
MPSKFFSFLFIILLLLHLYRPLAYAARPAPAAPTAIPSQGLAGESKQSDGEMTDENCDGVGEEECLMRRTLAAHLDYILDE